MKTLGTSSLSVSSISRDTEVTLLSESPFRIPKIFFERRRSGCGSSRELCGVCCESRFWTFETCSRDLCGFQTILCPLALFFFEVEKNTLSIVSQIFERRKKCHICLVKNTMERKACARCVTLRGRPRAFHSRMAARRRGLHRRRRTAQLGQNTHRVVEF